MFEVLQSILHKAVELCSFWQTTKSSLINGWQESEHMHMYKLLSQISATVFFFCFDSINAELLLLKHFTHYMTNTSVIIDDGDDNN
jgi:hypothetical protein